MKIDPFLVGFTALHEEPGDIYTPILLPGDFDPFERQARFTQYIDAELRLTGLGSAGGGSAIQFLDEDDDEDEGGDRQWRVLYSIIDTDVTDLDAGRDLIRLQLAELGCPAGTLLQFDDREDRWDGERWHLAETRSIDEDNL